MDGPDKQYTPVMDPGYIGVVVVVVERSVTTYFLYLTALFLLEFYVCFCNFR
jgi:hypothetical protein